MPKKTCPNGHVYDTSIYGDQCPMCPAQPIGGGQAPFGETQVDPSAFSHAGSTTGAFAGMGTPADNKTHISGAASSTPGFAQGGFGPAAGPVRQMPQDNSGETKVRPNDAVPGGAASPRTTIRRPGAAGGAAAGTGENSRRLVGFLVTYNRNPMGKAYNIYEGRNYIGRDAKCNICVPDDDQMSGTHMSILFRNVDSKFKFRDEQSSNGTFVNKELLDEGELKNYDIIRVGNTLFIFMAIPMLQ